ncbi:tetratricopeptide repeat protein [Candidatus Viridilinea mediisalina]|uniref:Uncharacterized protein n=1 Tax=Candidatus Viridilinea mediisalina TaxID=2024553 RepID=A0A2A6RE41_9CHLR|nr:tetratricopeptide repeat protein [Candidatus Viridilinea mediisalina]PDW00419.1 hypothetical protein CJ255_20705 [Candidatus Viridilinea mediisalina]
MGGIRTESARLYAQLGALLWRQGALNEAAKACQAGLATLPDEPAAPGERSALLQRLAMVEGVRSTYSCGMDLLTQSLELARQAGDALLMGAILHNMGYLANAQGQQEAARHYYQESLRLKEETGDIVGVIHTTGNLGLVALACGDLIKARNAFIQVCDLSRQFHMPALLAAALHNLGQLAYEQGAWVEAQRHLHTAIRLQ